MSPAFSTPNTLVLVSRNIYSSSSSSLSCMVPNKHSTLKVLERCRVAPPPNSVPRTALRLTFFDIMWLDLLPVQRLFFYRHSDPAASTLLSNLKQSLSLALQIFFPFAGNLVQSPESDHYELLYTEGDAVQLTTAESDLDFHHLVGSHPRDVTDFHTLVPHLTPTDSSPSPILAIQVTIFPNSGLSIGYILHHAAADGWSISHFMKSWSHICRTGDASTVEPIPIYDRTQTSGLDWITKNHFREMERVKVSDKLEALSYVTTRPHAVRASFKLSRTHIERLRNWVTTRRVLKSNHSKTDCRYSSFALTCAYLWVCLVRARMPTESEKVAHFCFAADGRGRLFPPLPTAYFGNCIGACFAQAKVGELTREEGLIVAVESIESAIRGLEGDGFIRDAESWIGKFAELASTGERIVSVAGSPRLRVYDTDFGCGRPAKLEVLSIDGTGGMSLEGCRDEEGALEISLALSESEMNSFEKQFEEGLKSLF